MIDKKLDLVFAPHADQGAARKVTAPKVDRKTKAIEIISERIKKATLLDNEYTSLLESEQKERDKQGAIRTGLTDFAIRVPNRGLGYTPTINDIPNKIRAEMKSTMQTIRAEREKRGLNPLVAHGTYFGSFLDMIKDQELKECLFGDFLLDTYGEGGAFAETGFWDDKEVWIIAQTEDLEFPLPLDKVTVVIPHPKAEIKILNILKKKLTDGELDSVGINIAGLEELGVFAHTHDYQIPSEAFGSPRGQLANLAAK